MLANLYIQNLAVVEKVIIEFGDGMNLFTGETGAGKSIVIDAINSIIGGRCSKEMVRTGEKKAVIIGTFQNLFEDVVNLAKEYDWDISDDQLIVQRDISSDGKTTARVNGMPVTISNLKEVGALLVNVHGQHDNQILLSQEKHLQILDDYGNLEDLLDKYRYHYSYLKKINSELEKINSAQSIKSQRIEELTDQINEIEQADIEEGEDIELESDSRAIKNSANILKSLNLAHESISGTDDTDGVIDLLNDAVAHLDNATAYYDDIAEPTNRLRDLLFEIKDIAYDLSSQCNNLDFNPNKLDAIELRLDEIFKIKRKYGPTIEDVNNNLKKFKDELEKIEMYDVRQNELIVSQKAEMKQVETLGAKLSEQRKKTADIFTKTVSDELAFLDMKGVVLKVMITPHEPGFNGLEDVEFLISTNVGEPPKPIHKIASGGELSRIMLSIKNTLADKDQIPTLVFDEIDTGVSGLAAQKIGLKLKQAAKHRQVLCVTHLAQIAALADEHFKISKTTLKGRTFTAVTNLDKKGRIEEVARIMSAGSITNLTLETAQEMIEKGQKV